MTTRAVSKNQITTFWSLQALQLDGVVPALHAVLLRDRGGGGGGVHLPLIVIVQIGQVTPTPTVTS